MHETADSDWVTAIAAAVTAVLSGVFAWLAGRRKSNADFTVSLTSGFDVLTRRLQQDNAALREELRQLRHEIERLRSQLEVTGDR
jgi:hypothetical protein